VRSVAEPKILPETFYAAGQLFEAQGLLTKAAIQYRKAAAVNHTFAIAYERLGVTLGRLGKHPQAVEALQTAVKLNPESASFHNNLAFEFVLLGRWTEAEAELIQAIDLEPNFDRAHINLGVVQANLDRFVEALIEFRKVVAEADAYYNLGLLLCGQHRFADAANAFDHVLTLNDEFEAARVQLERISPQLALADALEPRLTMPLDTIVTVATAEDPTTQPTTEIADTQTYVQEAITGETQPATETPVMVVETTTETAVTAETTITTGPTEVISEVTTQTQLGTVPDRSKGSDWPTDAQAEAPVSLTYDSTIESPATTGEAEVLVASSEEPTSLDDASPTQQTERTVLFSTVDTSTQSVASPTTAPFDGDWECFNGSEWSFPADSQWPFTGIDNPYTTWDFFESPYDLNIESPAGTTDVGGTQSENTTSQQTQPVEAVGPPTQPSTGGQTSASTWNGDDSLQMPEPAWYQQRVGQADDAE